MSRSIQDPSIDIEDVVQPVAYGGTGANTAAGAAATLKLVAAALLDSPNGVASLDATGKASAAVMPTLTGVQTVNVRGNRTILKSAISKFEITDFDSTKTYVVSVSAGTVAVSGKNISVTAPSTAQAMTMTINGRVINLTVVSSLPSKPTFLTPTAGSSAGNLPQRFYISDYNSLGDSVAHASTDWQVAVYSESIDFPGSYYPDFSTPIASSIADAVNKTSWLLSTGLNPGSGYHVRARFRDANGNVGEWSDTTTFRVRTTFGPNLESAIVYPPDGFASQFFGTTVSLSDDGTVLAVGNASGTGGVYVFRRNNRGWYVEAKLIGSDTISTDVYGQAVSLSGDGLRLIVGAGGAAAGATPNAGAAYIFVYNNGIWSQEAKLTAGDKVAYDNFGCSIFINSDGSRVVVGAQQWTDTTVTNTNGKAYVFSRTGTSWTQEAKLVGSDSVANDRFGVTVLMSRDALRVAVTAISAVGGVNFTGAVYMFSRSGTTWSQEAKLTEQVADRQQSAFFGVAMRFSGDNSRIVIGSYGWGAGSGINQSGHISVMTRSGTTWSLEQSFGSPSPNANYRFGISCAISADGKKLYVGETRYNLGIAGRCHVYTRSGSVWTFQQTLIGSQDNPSGPGNTGTSVAISYDGLTLAFGADRTTSNGNSSGGKVYINT